MKIFMGGTYDPVHVGHLRMALELSEHFQGAGVEVHLMPSFQSVHGKVPGATPSQRVEMLGLATASEPTLVVDRREIVRAGPSYTVDSLRDIRSQYGADEPVALVLGVDAFNGLADWREWQDIPALAHLIVLHRPGYTLPKSGEMGDLLESLRVETLEALFGRGAGYILPLTLTPLEISSSRIRAAIAAGYSARYLIPDAVWCYICDNGLYGYRGETSLVK